MSVPVNQRSHGKLEACSKAYELSVYTLRITKNKKIFTEDYQDVLTDKITNLAVDIFILSKAANDIVVRTEKDKENYNARIAMQTDAIRKCRQLSSMILLAKPIFHLSSKRVKYWVGLTKETRTLLKAWSDSDKKRFSHLFENRGVG